MAHSEHNSEAHKKLKLPVMVSGPVELGRLVRELGDIDDALKQLALREGGSKTKMPQTSRLMDELISLNKLNLLHDEDRKALTEYLVKIREQAPVVHMSFSADPSAAFIEKLMAWLRNEIDHEILLTIGLQPNLGAGSILRTTNKYFDLSLRKDFETKQQLLKDIVRKSTQQTPVQEVAA